VTPLGVIAAGSEFRVTPLGVIAPGSEFSVTALSVIAPGSAFRVSRINEKATVFVDRKQSGRLEFPVFGLSNIK
jgi:hypothetical protein